MDTEGGKEEMTKACADYFQSFADTIAALKFVGFIGIFVVRSLAHHILRPFGQPYLTTDFAIGLVLGNINKIRRAFSGPYAITLNNMIEFGMICHMFVLGLEMNPYEMLKPPTKVAMLAYSGMLTTFILACSTTPFLRYTEHKSIYFTLALSIMTSGNGSPVLTRIITDLKIRRSDIGKLGIAVGIHSDMVSMLLYCIGFIIFPEEKPQILYDRIISALGVTGLLVIQVIFTAKVSPIFLNWVNNENPEGKPLKGSHLVMSLAFMFLICSPPTWMKYNPILSAFTAGLFLPNQGRMSKWLIHKINYLLSTVFYPLFFFWVGFMFTLKDFAFKDKMAWARFFSLLVIVILGKIAGTVMCGAVLGYHIPETASLGLLLTAKGHFHMFLAAFAIRTHTVTSTTGTMMLFVVLITVVYTPYVIMDIIKRARKRVPIHIMALQWLDPTTELQVLIGLHGSHHIQPTINLMEISQGSPKPGSVFYAMDMIELTGAIAATLQSVEGSRSNNTNNNSINNPVNVTDEMVMRMREEITEAMQEYMERGSREGFSVRRMQVLSTFNTMAQDVCALAEDLMVSLIVLPFHKRQNPDGTLDEGHPGFRYVNRKVLKNAPCSVGILVDRSFGKIEEISGSKTPIDVAVIFIAGPDDREALAFAGHVARHPGVKLKVIRFLVEKTTQNVPRRGNILSRENAAEQEEEMKLDDERFAEFYERYVVGGRASYMEKHLANSSETFRALKSLQGAYSLVIVGRGGRVGSVLTIGLNDWQQCPELGPIGDVLSGSDFSDTTSVLIIQQQQKRGQLEGLHDDFSIM